MRADLLCCLGATLGACATTVAPPPADRTPVVEGLLLADSATALFRIVWASPIDTFEPAGPVSPGDVDLRLSSATGGSAPLAPVPDSASWFRARLPIVRGGAYQLAGRIAGRAIAAATTVPLAFEIVEPAPDTIQLAGLPVERRPFRWRAVAASAFYARGARVAPFATPNTRDTAGELVFDRPPGSPSVSPLLLFAITAEADAYLFDVANPRSNVRGGFGFLGGAIAASRVIRWP